jgi:hypothetical protein
MTGRHGFIRYLYCNSKHKISTFSVHPSGNFVGLNSLTENIGLCVVMLHMRAVWIVTLTSKTISGIMLSKYPPVIMLQRLLLQKVLS